MYIPMRRPEEYREPTPLRENETDNSFLLEAAHAFDEQYKWAKKCAEVIYKAIEEGRTNISVAFKGAKDTTLKGAKIKISTDNILNTSASIKGIGDNRYVEIGINAQKNILEIDKDEAENEIWDAIVHELGHGNIYWQRYRNDQEINDTPEDYKKWCEVISDNNIKPNDILYLFCYALYSTYYHEVQAFVSQAYSDTVVNLRKIYGKTKGVTKEQFINALIQTNTYQTYKTNINTAERLIDLEGLRVILSKRLEDYNLFYGEEEILKIAKKIKETSYNALKKTYNNTYQWFYKSFL